MPVSIKIISESDQAAWDRYVARSPAASLYHLYGWRRVVEETFGHRTFYLAATDASGIVGVLPIVQLKSLVFGNMLVSLPFFNYGGVCGDTPEGRTVLLNAAIDLARDRGADFLELRHEDDWDQGLARRTSKVSMRLDLPSSADELSKSFTSKLRNQIQRPRKAGMAGSVGTADLLDDFYAVFSANMRDLGTPVYPKAFFRNILDRFPDQTRIVAVHAGRVPVAAGFLAGFRDRLEIPWASSARAYNRFSPNMLLYWSCLEYACGNGYRVFDFGRSTAGGGTYRFKEQWGARPQPLYWYYWLPGGGGPPEVNPDNPKYRFAIAVWQRLPLALTRLLGPHIVKNIP